MNRRALITATIVFLTTVATTTAQTWIDITSTCISDPNFSHNNYDGWDVDGWAQSTTTRAGCQEFWNGVVDFYRTISVPTSGRYRVSVQGYYRPGDFNRNDWQAHQNGTEEIACYLVAGSARERIASIYSASSDIDYGGFWSITVNEGGAARTYYYPNTMEAGARMFAMSHYNNSVETTVDGSCELLIGISMDAYESSNWVLFTGWKVEWYGTEVAPTAIRLSDTNLNMTVGEQHQLTATVQPDNATFKNVVFSSNKTSVVSVDANGLLTARSPGTAIITARMGSGASDIKAQCTVTVTRDEVQPGAIVINEIQVANIDQYLDPSFNFGGWVELYNPTGKSASLDGIVVTDNRGNRMQMDTRFGAVPAHGYKNVWFDHYSAWSPQMVDFKLDADGGTITFSRSDGTQLATQQYPAAVSRTSYARTTDAGTTWGLTSAPTPEATNATSAFATTQLNAPVTSRDGGIITSGSVSLRVTIPSGATLRYTTDGTTPTMDNGETSSNGRFTFNSTTALRLRLFQTGKLASPVVTRTFIFPDRNYSLPIIAITSDNDILFGDDCGIFVRGNGNGRPGNGQDAACNWNMSWDRPVNMEYITTDGQDVFNQEVTIEAAGGWSRAWSPHSFNIKANKIYEGTKRMDYQFFDTKPYLRHKALKVRNGGNDTSCRIKDAAIQEIVRTSGLNIETQAYHPVHVLFNGEYYATLNLREPNNRHYAYANYGIDTDEQDQWKMSPDSGYVQQAGTKDSWDRLLATAAQAESPYFYRQVCEQMDIESYINYMAVMFYIGGTDWPQNNIKAFRAWDDSGKFRFVVFDTDGAFSTSSPFTEFANKQTYTFDALRGAEERYPYGYRITDEIEFVTLFLNLLKNSDFRKQFIDQFCLVAGSVFEPQRVKEVVDGLVAVVNPALSMEWTSADNTANAVKSSLSSGRQTSLVNALRNYLGLSAPITAKLSSDTPGAGLRVNGLPVPTGTFSGRLFPPAKVTATAPPGYTFRGWASNVSESQSALIPMGGTWRYYDSGSLDNTGWKTRDYNDASWKSGSAPLGYDTGNAQKAAAYGTTVSYGGNSSNKNPTCYFRQHITLSETPRQTDVFTLNWVADDGFVIYVNGTEAGRFLMNNTPSPTYSSLADTYAPANPESGTMTLSTELFRQGDNVIAVELHNNSVSSTDLYWDASIAHASSSVNEQSIISTQSTYTLPESGSITLIAVYQPMSEATLAKSDTRPVKINEVSAANTVYANDHFKQNDWIELFNTTNADIDIAGMYLSDHADQPEKFRIPASNGQYSTIVPAHGFLVIWADKLESLTQLHADFKLASEEGAVVLTAADHSWADTLSYCTHTGLQSVGLYPDGGTEVYVMRRPTIGATNTVTLEDKPWQEPHDQTVDAIAAQGSATMSIAYQAGYVTMTGADEATLHVINAAGQEVASIKLRESIAVQLTALPRGVYMLRAATATETVTIKVSL